MKETEKKSIIELLDSMLRGNPVELCGVLASTNLLVLETLDRLEYSAVRNASIRTYLTCDNSEMEYLLNDFDALVVLAKDTPEFFARKLHSYCEKMAERIRTEDGCIDALLQLASKLQELRRIEKRTLLRQRLLLCTRASFFIHWTISAMIFLTMGRSLLAHLQMENL